MANALTFKITFHGPFRVSSGSAGGGLDAVVDRGNPLPGSSLKGLMRDAAVNILRADSALVAQVFGTEFAASAWVWCDAEPGGGTWPTPSVRARVSIDEETHTVLEDRIMLGAVLEPTTPATFEVVQSGAVGAAERPAHEALIRSAAAAIKHIGAERRRGLGWVSVEGDRPIAADDIRLIRAGGTSDA